MRRYTMLVEYWLSNECVSIMLLLTTRALYTGYGRLSSSSKLCTVWRIKLRYDQSHYLPMINKGPCLQNYIRVSNLWCHSVFLKVKLKSSFYGLVA